MATKQAAKPQDRKKKAPTFHIINLGDTEVKVSLKLKMRHILALINLEDQGEMAQIGYMVDHCVSDEAREAILEVDDEICIPELMKLMEAVGERLNITLGASLGESDGSSTSNGTTEEP